MGKRTKTALLFGLGGTWLSNSYYWNARNVCAVLEKLTHSINTRCAFGGLDKR